MACDLLQLALRENWSIPQSTVDAMMEQLAGVLEEPGMMQKKPRLYLKCIQALQSLSKKNLQSVDTGIRAQAADQLDERVKAIESMLHERGQTT
jgi:hypothetical protein